MDPNIYATRKTVAQGMMDIALMTANASQLKYVLMSWPRSYYFSVTIGLITLSIILQVSVLLFITTVLSLLTTSTGRRVNVTRPEAVKGLKGAVLSAKA